MIYFPQTRAFISSEKPVAVGFSIDAEGQALVGVTQNGEFGVKPSAGTASEVFAGIAVSQQILITSKARAEQVIVPVGLSFDLDRTPQAGTLALWNATDGAVVAGGDITLAGRNVTLAAGYAGKTVTAFYKYAVTVAESRALQGDVPPGGAAGASISQVGVFKNGVVFTDQFDTTVNWNALNPVVRLGANGQFTIGGTGTIVNCTITQAPSANSAFLGLDLHY